MSEESKNTQKPSGAESPKDAAKEAKKEDASAKKEEVKKAASPKKESTKEGGESGERPAIAKKKAQVAEFTKEFSASKNIVVLDLRKLPDRLLQSMRKKLREDGTRIRMAKSTVLKRALEGAKKPKELIDLFDKPAAVVFTAMSPYELNKFFRGNTMDVAAKPGQVAPEDIVVPAGETQLPPGPALSELKAAGINAQIRGPKISVVKDSTVVKAGEEITLVKAKALQTLGFKPFKVNANILLAYDGEYVYSPDLLDISAESLAPEFTSSLQDAFNMSVNASYPSGNNIELLVTEAFMQGMNAGINGEIYSPQSIEQLLARSIRGGLALSELNLEAAAPAKEEAAAEAPKEGEKDASASPESPSEEPKAETSPDASAGEGKEPSDKPEENKEKETGKPEEKKGE
jgi:large subunit ribosomal protein L10